MPPCLDVYVWLPGRQPDTLRAFVDRYVSLTHGDDRLHALLRTYVDPPASPADAATLRDLGRGDRVDGAFSLYLNAQHHHQAIITITAEGAVLGLSIDDPDDRPEVFDQARQLLERLRAEFGSPAGVMGVELRPPQDRSEWEEEDQVLLRSGYLPAA
jgi:hypothetical protein